MNIIQPTTANTVEMYTRIRKMRPRWFHVCLHIDPEEFIKFQWWATHEMSFWFDGGDTVAFAKSMGHVLEFHAAFLKGVDIDFLRGVVEKSWNMGFRRLEIPVDSQASHLIRKIVTDLGFKMEGIMRAKQAVLAAGKDKWTYLDVEMWAMVEEGDHQ